MRPALTPEVVHHFADHGTIRLIVDTEAERIYVIPRPISDLAFVTQLLKTDDDLHLHHFHAPHLVPSHIGINDHEQVNAIHTGTMNLSASFHIPHHNSTIDKAHALVKRFVHDGGVPRADVLTERITYPQM